MNGKSLSFIFTIIANVTIFKLRAYETHKCAQPNKKKIRTQNDIVKKKENKCRKKQPKRMKKKLFIRCWFAYEYGNWYAVR